VPPDGTAMTGTVETAGVDWLTCHVPHGAKARHLADWGQVLLSSEKRKGNDFKKWKWNGYEGYTAGHVALGGREDGVICRMSGEASREHWRHVWDIAQRCSRLDVQVTVSGLPKGHDLAANTHALVKDFRPKRGRPPEWELRLTKSHGSTLYLGSRQSQTFTRLYDKSAEEEREHLGGRWRYELELKEETAQQAASHLSSLGNGSARVLSTVHDAFTSRGVQPVFVRSDQPMMELTQRDQSDDDRRLAWLSGQVRAVVAGLRHRGRELDVMHALGLGESPIALPGSERNVQVPSAGHSPTDRLLPTPGSERLY